MASSVTKHTPVYNLTVRYGNTSSEGKTIELSSPFTRWFDADGFFVAKPFQLWLASEIPLIGEVDSRNSVGGSGTSSGADRSSEMTGSAESQNQGSPKKTNSGGQTPGSTKSRKVKKASD